MDYTNTRCEVGFKDCWGVAKLVKAPDFDSGMRRFESFLPSPNTGIAVELIDCLVYLNSA